MSCADRVQYVIFRIKCDPALFRKAVQSYFEVFHTNSEIARSPVWGLSVFRAPHVTTEVFY